MSDGRNRQQLAIGHQRRGPGDTEIGCKNFFRAVYAAYSCGSDPVRTRPVFTGNRDRGFDRSSPRYRPIGQGGGGGVEEGDL